MESMHSFPYLQSGVVSTFDFIVVSVPGTLYPYGRTHACAAAETLADEMQGDGPDMGYCNGKILDTLYWVTT